MKTSYSMREFIDFDIIIDIYRIGDKEAIVPMNIIERAKKQFLDLKLYSSEIYENPYTYSYRVRKEYIIDGNVFRVDK